MAALPASDGLAGALTGLTLDGDEDVTADVPAPATDIARLASNQAPEDTTVLHIAAGPQKVGPALLGFGEYDTWLKLEIRTVSVS